MTNAQLNPAFPLRALLRTTF